jgi:hypothetical protein
VRLLSGKRDYSAAQFSGNGDDMAELAEWDSFYVIVGSAAGALIGLQFVVLTLIANRSQRPEAEAGAAFATPTIIHFCATLFLAAIIRAPWQTVSPVAVLLGLVGVTGVVYAFIVARRMRAQTTYQPVFEEWLFHFLLPLAAYAVLAVSSFAAPLHTRKALFGVGTSALLLLFIGIHNAWDAVTHHVFVEKRENRKDEPGQ